MLGKSPTICLQQSYYFYMTVPQENRKRPSGWFANEVLIHIWGCILKCIFWIYSKNIYPWQLSPAQLSPHCIRSSTGNLWYSLFSYPICLIFSPQLLCLLWSLNFYIVSFFWLCWVTDRPQAHNISISSIFSYRRCSVSFLIIL